MVYKVLGKSDRDGIESVFAMLKQSYQSTFHYFSEKHLDRYVSESAGPYGIWEQDTVDQIGHIAHRMDGKRLWYQDLAD